MTLREEYLKLLADGCGSRCDYDEGEGGLMDHCRSCKDRIAQLSYLFFVEKKTKLQGQNPEFPVEEFSNGLTKAQEEMFQLLEEECAELIQAASKIKRHGMDRSEEPTGDEEPLEDGSRYTNLIEEAADVVACLGMLSHNGLIDPTRVNKTARKKLERLKDPKTSPVHFITPDMIP